ncbi:hypothetical protein ABVK25_011183 [Lepraria finkii]|uniref:Uncharacterized protein n=1 Tax=Lepraria finkii TaxID=1340010 RepID=A0ABR4AQE9_9LECA
MTNSITIAWAMPVDAATLGARMEAHAKSKATIHTFRLCVQHAPPGAPLGRLPPELVEIVAARIQQSLFKKRMKKWKKSVNCAAGDCYPSDHFSQKEILSMKSDLAFCCQTDDEGDDSYCERFEMHLLNKDIGDDEHMQAVKTFLPKVEDNSFIEKTDKFAKCRKIFAQDFGLEAYFTVHRIYHWVFPSTIVLAYLILPSLHSALKTSSGTQVVSYMSSIIINPSIFQDPSPDHKARFQTAMRTLQLRNTLCAWHTTESRPTSERLPLAERVTPRYETLGCKKFHREAATLTGSSEWPKLMILGSGEHEA